jgi:Cu/Zn superoxide dismutase
MKTLGCLAAIVFAVQLVAPVLAATNTMNHMTNAMSAHSMTINMGAQNGSKQDGQAWLNDTPKGLRVKIQLKNEPAGASEPSHIHQGTCAKLNPAPWKALSNVVGGVSVTTLPGVTIAQLKKAHYAINVHESAANLKRYVSCGDL